MHFLIWVENLRFCQFFYPLSSSYRFYHLLYGWLCLYEKQAWTTGREYRRLKTMRPYRQTILVDLEMVMAGFKHPFRSESAF